MDWLCSEESHDISSGHSQQTFLPSRHSLHILFIILNRQDGIRDILLHIYILLFLKIKKNFYGLMRMSMKYCLKMTYIFIFCLHGSYMAPLIIKEFVMKTFRNHGKLQQQKEQIKRTHQNLLDVKLQKNQFFLQLLIGGLRCNHFCDSSFIL